MTVITGKNETLRRELEKTYPTFEIVGFTSRVAEYMARADLLLTKAGGITTFEAIHSGTPLCLLRPFLMQEEANAAYVQAQGFGKVLWNKSREAQDILDLLADQETLEDMKQRMAVALRSLDQVSPVDRFWAEQAAC